MLRNKTYHRKKVLIVFVASFLAIVFLTGRLVFLMVFCSQYYGEKAEDLHQRERSIKAARGEIIDRNGVVLATNRTVCTVSVIHSQIKDAEKVIETLTRELGISEEEVRKRVEKVSSIERVKSNVDKKVGDAIRAYNLEGVKVDEDYKRYYPFGNLASRTLGFTGSDNQGIVGLEVEYESYLKGKNGTILTLTDARGIEIEFAGESRVEPVAGSSLRISLDSNIQMYAQQEAEKTMEKKQADGVSVLMMNPQNGEILAMVNVPEFDLNNPFTLTIDGGDNLSEEAKQNALNQMWRNNCINDTYEPGSTFKIVTAAAGLSEGVVNRSDRFHCPGYIVVEGRKIRCHKVGGHGAENFEEGIQNSCNPVFIQVGQRLGVMNFYKYFRQFGLLSKTNIDLPGEASTIMHKQKNVGPVELATISFGQSFQITPIQLATTVSSIINGGKRVTPHLGLEVTDANGKKEELTFDMKEGVVSEEVSEEMRELLEQVVALGSGKRAYIPGFHVGGKTATSQTLPRGTNKYISSFIGFAPANNPEVLCLLIIYNPKGIYYGGTIAAPVVKTIFENILPYLGISPDYTQEELEEMQKQQEQ